MRKFPNRFSFFVQKGHWLIGDKGFQCLLFQAVAKKKKKKKIQHLKFKQLRPRGVRAKFKILYQLPQQLPLRNS